jgi:transcriptional regulator with XRE-family HTH domain
MKMNKSTEAFYKLVSNESSDLLDNLKWRKANRDWLRKTRSIATKVLLTLKAKSMSQISLAEALNVSPQYVNKLLKGKENLSLETISKLETVLNISLIEIPEITAITEVFASATYTFPITDFNISFMLPENVLPAITVSSDNIPLNNYTQIKDNEYLLNAA